MSQRALSLQSWSYHNTCLAQQTKAAHRCARLVTVVLDDDGEMAQVGDGHPQKTQGKNTKALQAKDTLQPISRAQNNELHLQHEVARPLYPRGTPVTNKHQTSHLVDHRPGEDL